MQRPTVWIVVALTLASFFLSASAQTPADPCTGLPYETCYSTNVNNNNNNCVFANNVCQRDPCSHKTYNMTACAETPDCVAILTSPTSAQLCMHFQLACSSLPTGSCETFPWCLKLTDGSCLYYVPGQGVAGNNDQSCLSFPTWSIALIVLWVLIMIVLICIIVLAVRQRRLDAITEVEESEAQVNSVHVDKGNNNYDDNFAPRDRHEANELQRPLRH